MKRTLTLALFALLLAACSGAQQAQLTSFVLPASVEVTFSALLPTPLSAGDKVMLSVVDEVTGLEFNPSQTEMQVAGAQSVSVSVSVPAGTLLKYRYVRQTPGGDVGELAPNGDAIAFRTFLVDGPGHVAHDVVAAWADVPLQLETGNISGTVTDAATGQPIPDLNVVAAGLHAQTDASGHFVIAGLPQGLHNVLVYSSSGAYLPFQQGALVAANNETPATISLTVSQMAAVTFWLTPPAEHTASSPVFIIGDLDSLAVRPPMPVLSEGRYSITVQLPVGVDIRYKYTLGDGFWNAEHLQNGGFAVRQLILPAGSTSLQIDDQVFSWTAGSSAPIWFELTAPADSVLAYLQVNMGEWTTPLPMWPLGDGHWAYKLYSPTNFASPLEYRYCLDAACTILDASGQPRTFQGNQPTLQQLQDTIAEWGSQ